MKHFTIYLVGLSVVIAVIVAVLFITGILGAAVLREGQVAARARAVVEKNYDGVVRDVALHWVPMGTEFDQGCPWQQIVEETFARPVRPWQRCGFYRPYWKVQVSGDFSTDGHPDIDFIYVELTPEGSLISVWWINEMIEHGSAEHIRNLFQNDAVIPMAR